MKAKSETRPVKAPETIPARRSPWQMFDELREEMESLWRRPWSFRALPRVSGAWLPSTDVFRSNGELVVKADLPGMKKEDIDVAVENGDLVLRGERKEESEVEEDDVYRSERCYGSFYRRMPLPEGVKAKDLKAAYENGVLTVSVPLPEKETQAEHVKVA